MSINSSVITFNSDSTSVYGHAGTETFHWVLCKINANDWGLFCFTFAWNNLIMNSKMEASSEVLTRYHLQLLLKWLRKSFSYVLVVSQDGTRNSVFEAYLVLQLLWNLQFPMLTFSVLRGRCLGLQLQFIILLRLLCFSRSELSSSQSEPYTPACPVRWRWHSHFLLPFVRLSKGV